MEARDQIVAKLLAGRVVVGEDFKSHELHQSRRRHRLDLKKRERERERGKEDVDYRDGGGGGGGGGSVIVLNFNKVVLVVCEDEWQQDDSLPHSLSAHR